MLINIREINTHLILNSIQTTSENVEELCRDIVVNPEYGGVDIDYYFEIVEEGNVWSSLYDYLEDIGWAIENGDNE